MALISGKLTNTRVDLNSLVINSNWLDYITWQDLIYLVRAMKRLLIGPRFFYVTLHEWNCNIIHEEHSAVTKFGSQTYHMFYKVQNEYYIPFPKMPSFPKCVANYGSKKLRIMVTPVWARYRPRSIFTLILQANFGPLQLINLNWNINNIINEDWFLSISMLQNWYPISMLQNWYPYYNKEPVSYDDLK